MPYKVVDVLNISGEKVIILEKIKGKLTKQIIYHSGILPVGVKRKSPSFILSNGMRVKGKTLNKIITK